MSPKELEAMLRDENGIVKSNDMGAMFTFKSLNILRKSFHFGIKFVMSVYCPSGNTLTGFKKYYKERRLIWEIVTNQFNTSK